MSPKKSTNPLVIILAIALLIILPCVVGIFFIVNMAKQGMKMVADTVLPAAACAMNFEAARDAALDYAKEHDGKLPSAEKWQAEIEPYFRKLIKSKLAGENGPKEVLGTKIEMSPWPEKGAWDCRVGTDEKGTELRHGVALNADLAGKPIAGLKDKTVILFFETETVKESQTLPYTPKTKSSGPLIMGEHRDWLVIPVEGKGTLDIKTKKGTNISFSTGDDEPEKDTKAKDPDTKGSKDSSAPSGN
ncbi:MAG: hypothetical protein JST40_07030 [Armatimonadetes bacterium]|nr:hypothetical protein [Armatimonadota bacterium]